MDNLKGEITDLKAGKNPKVQRSNVYLNGKFAFSLDNEVIAREKLKVGKVLSSEEINKLAETDRVQLCIQAAFRFLSYRPRSEAEIRARLKLKGYNSQEIDQTTIKLTGMNLLNDESFAEFWKDNRNSFKPKSQRMVSLELKRKGVESEIIQQVVSDIDDPQNAHVLAAARARTLAITDFQVFRQKLSGYLQRRGFNYGVINNAVKQVWLERTQESGTQSDLPADIESDD